MPTYKTNFLKQVIFQVVYSTPALKLHIDTSLSELCSQKTGAQVTQGQNASVRFNLANNKQLAPEITTRWMFQGVKFQVIVQADMLQIINVAYDNHLEFHAVINDIFNKLKQLYSPAISRVSMRYINNINFENGGSFEFNNLIDPDLLNGVVKFKDEKLTRSIGQILFAKDAEDLSVTFLYGFINSQFPNIIAKREFLLDYDCYTDYTNQPDKNIPINDILSKISNKINGLFEKSIMDGLREKMN